MSSGNEAGNLTGGDGAYIRRPPTQREAGAARVEEGRVAPLRAPEVRAIAKESSMP